MLDVVLQPVLYLIELSVSEERRGEPNRLSIRPVDDT